MTAISEMVSTALILHNQYVSDRVMNGDVYATYDPTNSLEVPPRADRILYPADSQRPPFDQSDTPPEVAESVMRGDRWGDLQNTEEHDRLFNILLNQFKTV